MKNFIIFFLIFICAFISCLINDKQDTIESYRELTKKVYLRHKDITSWKEFYDVKKNDGTFIDVITTN